MGSTCNALGAEGEVGEPLVAPEAGERGVVRHAAVQRELGSGILKSTTTLRPAAAAAARISSNSAFVAGDFIWVTKVARRRTGKAGGQTLRAPCWHC